MFRIPKTLIVRVALASIALASGVDAQTKKPNIIMIMGDDIGIPNVSCYSHGMMGYKTRNIDRIAKGGVMLKDYPPSQKPASFNLDRVFEQFLSQPGTH